MTTLLQSFAAFIAPDSATTAAVSHYGGALDPDGLLCVLAVAALVALACLGPAIARGMRLDSGH